MLGNACGDSHFDRNRPAVFQSIHPRALSQHWHGCCIGLSRMRFALEIGETEKNRLEFSFNQLFGSTVIKVNDKLIKKNVRLFSEPLQEKHEFEVGKNERHTVFIEKRRKLLFGQKYLVYVNQRLVKLLHGV